jgi:serralysin
LIGDANANILGGQGGNDLLIGGAGDDILIGDESNVPYGGVFGTSTLFDSGSDILNGGLGADTLDGGAGLDYASYNDASSGITARLDAPGLNTGEAAGDTYTSIEGLIGSQQTDVLVGDAQANVLYGSGSGDYLFGQEGGDFLVGGEGADILDGGAGFDTASYETSTSGVFARLDIGSGTFGDAQGDSYTSIEGLIGSAFADILVGDGAGNELRGGTGVDQLTGGAGGDLLNGGEGFDFARYDLAGSGVTVRLDLGVGLGGDAQGDTYVSIEGAVGSEQADVLVGTSAGNYVFGLGGSDTIYGFGGYDEIYGGAGADTFVFRAADIPGGFATIRDYIALEGDGFVFEGVAAGSLEIYQSGVDAVIQLPGGTGGIVVANTSLAELGGHLFYA